MRTNQRPDKRAVMEELLQGNRKPLERLRERSRPWITVIASPPILAGCEESPDDLFTSITVHPDELGSCSDMTRKEFNAFCEKLTQQYNLFLVV